MLFMIGACTSSSKKAVRYKVGTFCDTGRDHAEHLESSFFFCPMYMKERYKEKGGGPFQGRNNLVVMAAFHV